MSDRFFVNEPLASDHATLAGDEARHLTAVMRASLGDEITLFDGTGLEYVGRIAAIHKSTVELTIIQRREISRELNFSLTLAVALPKGDRQKWLVEKATELGVTSITPLITERGVAQPTESALDRLRRTVIEASKQCGRNRLLEIAPPAPAGEFFAAAPPSTIRLLADPAGESLTAVMNPSSDAVIAAIGPEGGFTPAEVAAATASGWKPVSLGARILRVETAAIALAAYVSCARITG
jgi:16S rRNA (uracil1498-N3)-methyltransferase